MTKHDRAFNSEALYVALDKRRRDLRISWRELLRQAECRSIGLITKLGQGKSISADTLVRLLLWLGETDIRPYAGEAKP